MPYQFKSSKFIYEFSNQFCLIEKLIEIFLCIFKKTYCRVWCFIWLLCEIFSISYRRRL